MTYARICKSDFNFDIATLLPINTHNPPLSGKKKELMIITAFG